MQKRNKIISKRLLPVTIFVSLVIPAMFATFGYMVNDETKGRPFEANDKEFIALYTILTAICAGLLLLTIVDERKSNYEFASRVAREYLKNEMMEHPEMKAFEKVLRNPRAIRSIATMISNSLRESERKIVISAINEMIKTETKTREEKIAAVKKAQAKIVKVIQEHASTDHNFINEVYVAMARADTMYVVPTQQLVR